MAPNRTLVNQERLGYKQKEEKNKTLFHFSWNKEEVCMNLIITDLTSIFF